MAATAEQVEVAGRTVRLTSAEKVYFPERGFTKGDVFRYYLAVGDGIMRAREDEWVWLRAYASHTPAVVGAVALVLCLQFPFRDLVKPETYESAPRAAVAQQVMDKIPDGASVETDLGLLTELVSDHTVYWIGSDNASVTPDYVLIDAWAGWAGGVPDAAEYAMALHPGTTYKVVFSRDDYELARRVG